jgi:hypothetical protein
MTIAIFIAIGWDRRYLWVKFIKALSVKQAFAQESPLRI